MTGNARVSKKRVSTANRNNGGLRTDSNLASTKNSNLFSVSAEPKNSNLFSTLKPESKFPAQPFDMSFEIPHGTRVTTPIKNPAAAKFFGAPMSPGAQSGIGVIKDPAARAFFDRLLPSDINLRYSGAHERMLPLHTAEMRFSFKPSIVRTVEEFHGGDLRFFVQNNGRVNRISYFTYTGNMESPHMIGNIYTAAQKATGRWHDGNLLRLPSSLANVERLLSPTYLSNPFTNSPSGDFVENQLLHYADNSIGNIEIGKGPRNSFSYDVTPHPATAEELTARALENGDVKIKRGIFGWLRDRNFWGGFSPQTIVSGPEAGRVMVGPSLLTATPTVEYVPSDNILSNGSLRSNPTITDAIPTASYKQQPRRTYFGSSSVKAPLGLPYAENSPSGWGRMEPVRKTLLSSISPFKNGLKFLSGYFYDTFLKKPGHYPSSTFLSKEGIFLDELGHFTQQRNANFAVNLSGDLPKQTIPFLKQTIPNLANVQQGVRLGLYPSEIPTAIANSEALAPKPLPQSKFFNIANNVGETVADDSAVFRTTSLAAKDAEVIGAVAAESRWVTYGGKIARGFKFLAWPLIIVGGYIVINNANARVANAQTMSGTTFGPPVRRAAVDWGVDVASLAWPEPVSGILLHEDMKDYLHEVTPFLDTTTATPTESVIAFSNFGQNFGQYAGEKHAADTVNFGKLAVEHARSDFKEISNGDKSASEVFGPYGPFIDLWTWLYRKGTGKQ